MQQMHDKTGYFGPMYMVKCNVQSVVLYFPFNLHLHVIMACS